MANEKYYKYYITNEATRVELETLYNSTINSKRLSVQQKLLDDTGAICWQEQQTFGGKSYISSLVFPYTETVDKHIKVCNTDYYEGEKVNCVRGKLNSKAGISFNEPMDTANNALKELPNFKEWLVDEFDAMRTCLGENHPSGRGMGTSMLSTRAGTLGDVLCVIVPCKGDAKPFTPDERLTEISYGVFYDMSSISYYSMTNEDLEEQVDFVKVQILKSLVKDNVLSSEDAETWCENHTIVKRKKSFFRTISDKWSKEECDKSTAYWIVVSK